MVHRLPRFSVKSLVLAALLVAARDGGAQQSAPPAEDAGAVPPSVASPPQMDSKKELDAQIERAFGKGSAASLRPIRLWPPQVVMAIAAKEASVRQDGSSVRFVDVSLGFPFGIGIVHCTEAVVVADQSIGEIGHLADRNVVSVELQNKIGAAVLIRRAQMNPITMTKSFVEIALPLPAPPASPNSETNKTDARKIQREELNEKDLELLRRIVLNRPFFDFRFKFKLDSQAPLIDFLPTTEKMPSMSPLPFNEDLAQVAEISFGVPMPKGTSKHEAMEAIAHTIAKINHLNAKKHDGFILAMIENREDLRGLPFLMGDDCRSSEKQIQVFALSSRVVHEMRQTPTERLGDRITKNIVGNSEIERATVVGLVQILMPEAEPVRVHLAKCLATIPHIDATKALARLAIFSAEDTVRAAAIDGLKSRPERDYTEILLQGFNYPLPDVANRSAEALVKLERKDVLAELIDVLERPDPRLPVAEQRDGKDVITVRELVSRVEHLVRVSLLIQTRINQVPCLV